MSTSSKPFKIKDISEIDLTDGKVYITHPDKNTAIQIPTTVIRAVEKVNRSTILSDTLITALHLRSFGEDDKLIQNWHETSYDMYSFPQSQSNERFSKLMYTIFNETDHNLTNNEIDSLIAFFARTPHGYKLPNKFIHCHYELEHDIL